MICPVAGAVGVALTYRVNDSLADAQGDPSGLSVVMVIVIVFPPSEATGV